MTIFSSRFLSMNVWGVLRPSPSTRRFDGDYCYEKFAIDHIGNVQTFAIDLNVHSWLIHYLISARGLYLTAKGFKRSPCNLLSTPLSKHWKKNPINLKKPEYLISFHISIFYPKTRMYKLKYQTAFLKQYIVHTYVPWSFVLTGFWFQTGTVP